MADFLGFIFGYRGFESFRVPKGQVPFEVPRVRFLLVPRVQIPFGTEGSYLPGIEGSNPFGGYRGFLQVPRVQIPFDTEGSYPPGIEGSNPFGGYRGLDSYRYRGLDSYRQAYDIFS